MVYIGLNHKEILELEESAPTRIRLGLRWRSKILAKMQWML
jgi:hypothetical protein